MRSWATIWLVCQLTAVSAFVPRDCCANHRQAAAISRSHHQSDSTHGHHTGHGAVHQQAPRANHDRTCVMRGTCNGPLDAIATLFMTPGTPLQPFAIVGDAASLTMLRPIHGRPLDSLHLPATPPPRL